MFYYKVQQAPSSIPDFKLCAFVDEPPGYYRYDASLYDEPKR